MWFIPETDSFSFSPGNCQYVRLVNGENQCTAQAQCHDSFLAFQGLCNGNHSSKPQFLPSGCVNVNETKQGLWSYCITLAIDSVSAHEVEVLLHNPCLLEYPSVVLISLLKHSKIFGSGERRKFSHMLELFGWKGIFVYWISLLGFILVSEFFLNCL